MSQSTFSIHSIYRIVFKIWRRKRFELFCKILQPKITDKLLDVGGYPYEWTQYPRVVGKIDTLNIHEVAWDASKAPEYEINTLVGDGCHLSFTDKSYDIAFSNSVIEHVGTWDRQQAFAAEICRVGKALWLQTPAFECPVEPHFMALGVHWLPMRIRKFVARWLTPWGWLQRLGKKEADEFIETTRLLSKREMRLLFPDCEVRTERLLGFMPKSYIAIRKTT